MMSYLCNRCVREILILAHTWFAFSLPSKTGCDISGIQALLTVGPLARVALAVLRLIDYYFTSSLIILQNISHVD
jgi:hypothetical protein